MLPDKLPAYVHRKRAKGRVYLYFDTGQKTPSGKPVRVRLPDYRDPSFFRAYSALRDRREQRFNAPIQVLTVPAFCEAFRSSPRFRSKAKSTQASYETYLRVIEDQLDTFLALDVRPKDVAALHAKLGKRPGAANQCVRVLSALYAWGKSPTIGLVSHNPAEGIELFEGGEHEPWPLSLLSSALASKDPQVRIPVALLYYTGQRIGDVCAMRWSDIRDGVLYVTQQKTGIELEIPLHADLVAILAGLPKGLTTIVAKPNGTRYHDTTVRDWLKAFAAGHGHDVVPHGLRKNAVIALLEADCSVAEVSSITGQSLQMVEHYAKKRNRAKLARGAVLKWETKR